MTSSIGISLGVIVVQPEVEEPGVGDVANSSRCVGWDTGAPRNPSGNKELFDLASVGMAYGIYFNVTREQWAGTAYSRFGT